jgi:hypothetical protein
MGGWEVWVGGRELNGWMDGFVLTLRHGEGLGMGLDGGGDSESWRWVEVMDTLGL